MKEDIDATQKPDGERPEDLRLREVEDVRASRGISTINGTRRGYRDNLDKLTGRHAEDYTEAKDEARRAIVAKLEGRDPKGLVPSDDPTLAQLLRGVRPGETATAGTAGRSAASWRRRSAGSRPFGQWRASDVTADTLKAFRRMRPLVAGNRDLALLRAAVQLGGARRTAGPLTIPHRRRACRPSGARRTTEPTSTARRRRTAPRGGWTALHDLIVAALETGCRQGELLSAAMASGAILATRGDLPASGQDEGEAGSAHPDLDRALARC